MTRMKAAIAGSDSIGTDLMTKLLRHSQQLELAVMVGIQQASEGSARARTLGVQMTHEGVDGMSRMAEFYDICFEFDATIANAHRANEALLRKLKPDTTNFAGFVLSENKRWGVVTKAAGIKMG